jgi:hypothetical protein
MEFSESVARMKEFETTGDLFLVSKNAFSKDDSTKYSIEVSGICSNMTHSLSLSLSLSIITLNLILDHESVAFDTHFRLCF